MKMSGRHGCGIVAEPVVQEDYRKGWLIAVCNGMLRARKEMIMG